MKKYIVLAACLGWLSTDALAQSSVTIYGVVDAGVTATKIRHYEPASDSMERHARIGLDSGNLSASRIGIKGIENLGGGTEAIFNLEAGFNTDNGQGGDAYSSALFGRRAVVGLKNEHYGEFTMGRQDTVMGDAMKLVDPFADAEQYTAKSFIFYDSLMSNSLAYTTPQWQGLSAKLNYAFGENTDTDKKGTYYAASLNYNTDKLNMALAYSHSDYPLNWRTHTMGAQSTSGALYNYIHADMTPPTTRKQVMLAVAYDAGMVKPFAVLTAAKNDKPDYDDVERSTKVKEKTAEIGVTIPFGVHSVIGSVGYTNMRFTMPSSSAMTSDAWRYQAGYTYDFSRRTTFYTLMSYVKNGFSDEDYFRTQHNGYAEMSVGIRHRF